MRRGRRLRGNLMDDPYQDEALGVSLLFSVIFRAISFVRSVADRASSGFKSPKHIALRFLENEARKQALQSSYFTYTGLKLVSPYHYLSTGMVSSWQQFFSFFSKRQFIKGKIEIIEIAVYYYLVNSETRREKRYGE